MRVYVDIETRARVDLRTTNAYRYAEDPLFAILLAGWLLPGDEKVRIDYRQDDAVARFRGLWDAGAIFVAHNAAFERVCFSRALGLPVGTYLPADRFHDTQAIAAEHGLPQKLEKLAPALGAEPKDPAGTRLINLFCKPNRKGGWNGPETHPIQWMDFIAYLEQDVLTLRDVDARLPGGWPAEAERRVFLAHEAINDNGALVDLELAQAAVAAAERNRQEHVAELAGLTGLDNPNSNVQLLGWLRRNIRPAPTNLQAETVEELLKRDDLHDDVRRALELRQELALVASKKFGSALNSVSPDGRLRGSYRFYGAHTGRWTARGTQPHNLPREQFEKLLLSGKKVFDEDAQNAAIMDLMMGSGASALALKALVRSMFLGPLTVVDYSAIEARVIAWLAGEEWALEAFRAGRDIYVETAERMSTPGNQLSRSQGKVAVLALGYAGGKGSLRVMGAEGSDEELEALKHQWRRANRNIHEMWSSLEGCMRSLYDGNNDWRRFSSRWLDHLQIEERGTYGEQGHAYQIVLPSGRALNYLHPKWVPRRPTRQAPEGFWHPEMTFEDPKEHRRVRTYGGKLTENVTQAVARDIMAEALVRLVTAGFSVVGHTHDEILTEGSHYEDVRALMTVPPAWAAGLPIAAEGAVVARYQKL